MTIRHLTVFMKVCEKMNMTMAARELFVSQPAVSQTISELESYYNAPLFHRQSGKLHLTGAGEKLKNMTEQLLFWNAEIENAMKHTHTLPPIKLGGPFSAGEIRLPEIIAAYDREVGKARIYLTDSNSAELVRRILGSELDLALVDGETHSRDVVEIPLWEDELLFLCRADDPVLAGAEAVDGVYLVSCEQAAGRKWLIREEGSGISRAFEEEMHKHRIPYEVRGRFRSSESIRASAAAGLGIGVINGKKRGQADTPGVALFRIDGLIFDMRLSVVYHREKFLFPEFREFLDYLTGKARLMSQAGGDA